MADELLRTRRGRDGGARQARRAQRIAGDESGSGAPAYITRRIPTYELLGEEGLSRIEDHVDILLDEIGVEFRDDPEALRLWREAGARVDGVRVRFERGMLRELIQSSTPGSFVQHARNPERSVVIGGAHTVFSPAYGSPFVRDLEQGRRYASMQDFENFVKLAYQTPWLHHSGGTICEPVDVAVNKRHLDMVYAHIRYSDKAFMGSVTAPERAADSIDLARIVFGEDRVERDCVILGNINVNSPLVYDGTMSAALRTYAAANQCTVVVPFILGGAMGPVTVAGAVAQSMAEAMAGIGLIQLVRPGAPAILGNFLSSMSLLSGAPTFGMPEPAIGYLAVGQLARRLGVPLRCGGAITAAKLADAQAAQESADSLMPTLLAGANFIMHSAGWLEGGLVMGYEKFMLDLDHLGMMHVFANGLTLDDNAMALDAFREVGPGHHFLGCSHTMANYETAYYRPMLADNESFEQWQEGGELRADQRAHKAWQQRLADYQPPPLDPAIDDALKDFINRRKNSMADAWY